MFRLLSLLLLSLLLTHRASADPIYNFDGGPVKTAGTLNVTLSWTNATGPKTVTIPVAVSVKDSRQDIRDNVEKALNANPTVAADWTFKPDSKFGQVYWTDGTAGAGVTFVDATIAPAPGKSPTGKLTLSGGFTTALANPPQKDWFQVIGTGDLSDEIAVTLAMPSDGDYANLQTFSLASYAGLTGDQIDQQLANLINQSGYGFGATIQDFKVFLSGINTQFGADMLVSDGGNLQVISGVSSLPEATTLILVGTGLLGTLARVRWLSGEN